MFGLGLVPVPMAGDGPCVVLLPGTEEIVKVAPVDPANDPLAVETGFTGFSLRAEFLDFLGVLEILERGSVPIAEGSAEVVGLRLDQLTDFF